MEQDEDLQHAEAETGHVPRDRSREVERPAHVELADRRVERGGRIGCGVDPSPRKTERSRRTGKHREDPATLKGEKREQPRRRQHERDRQRRRQSPGEIQPRECEHEADEHEDRLSDRVGKLGGDHARPRVRGSDPCPEEHHLHRLSSDAGRRQQLVEGRPAQSHEKESEEAGRAIFPATRPHRLHRT